MKKLVFTNQKGGVGKSSTAVQFAYYCSIILKLRVLFVDLDHQRNSSKTLATGDIAIISAKSSNTIFTEETTDIEAGNFLVVPGDPELIKLERQEAKHNDFINNLGIFLQALDDRFDVCIMDTNPNPDIRQLAGLLVSGYAISPIQLNQEALDGIKDLLNHPVIGIRRIQTTINKAMVFIGILPNMVEPTPFQRHNFEQLSNGYSKLLIRVEGKGFGAIKRTTAIPEAQASGLPVWKLGKTSASGAWANIKPIFEQIAKTMGVTP